MFILVIKNSENVEIKLIIHTIFIVFAESITVFSLYVSNIYHSFFPLEAILSQIVTTNVLIHNPNICAIDIKDECNFFLWWKIEYRSVDLGIPAAGLPPYILFPSTSPISY